jgi:hypothetical protein
MANNAATTVTERRAAEALSEASIATGGAKALTKESLLQYIGVRRKHDAVLYAASVRRARSGAVTKRNLLAHRTRQRNVAAVAEAVHRARVAFGLIDADAQRRCTTRHDDDVVVICGRVTFTHTRGHRSTSAKSFVRSLAKLYRVIEVSEWGTSQRCNVCHGRLVRTRAHSVRYWRCESNGVTCHERDEQRKHEVNKDVSAALNMFQIGLALLLVQQRPLVFSSPRVVAFDALMKAREQAQQSPSAAASSSSAATSSTATRKRTRSTSSADAAAAESQSSPTPPRRKSSRHTS